MDVPRRIGLRRGTRRVVGVDEKQRHLICSADQHGRVETTGACAESNDAGPEFIQARSAAALLLATPEAHILCQTY